MSAREREKMLLNQLLHFTFFLVVGGVRIPFERALSDN